LLSLGWLPQNGADAIESIKTEFGAEPKIAIGSLRD
jgi:hypothetical protein